MSGLEVLLVVGAGIYVTKVVKDHRREKKDKKLIAAGLHPSQHAAPRVVEGSPRGPRGQGHQQQVPPVEEEALPLYSPPEKDTLPTGSPESDIHLPTYDETAKEKEEEAQKENANPSSSSTNTQQTTPPVSDSALLSPSTAAVGTKERPKKWKLWERNSTRKVAEVAQAQETRPAVAA